MKLFLRIMCMVAFIFAIVLYIEGDSGWHWWAFVTLLNLILSQDTELE